MYLNPKTSLRKEKIRTFHGKIEQKEIMAHIEIVRPKITIGE